MTIQVKVIHDPDAPAPEAHRDYVRTFDRLRKGDRSIAGGKGANLGELVSAHIPVPAGFVITATAYQDALASEAARAKLAALGQTRGDSDARAHIVDELSVLARAGIDDRLRSAIRRAYLQLGDTVRVAVRSSATSEALDCSAVANEVFTNVRGEEALLEAVVACWRRLWAAPALAQVTSPASPAARGPASHTEPATAVVVQHMVDADKAGIVWTSGRSGVDGARLVIEAAYGLGTVVLHGQVEPDTYTLDKTSLRLLEVCIGQKSHKLVAGERGDLGIALTGEDQRSRVLDDHELSELASLSIQIERHFGTPQAVEWSIFERTPYILRSREISAREPEQTRAAPRRAPGATLAEDSDS